MPASDHKWIFVWGTLILTLQQLSLYFLELVNLCGHLLLKKSII